MDRTFLRATVVFAAMAVAGVALTLFLAGVVADGAAIRARGPALLGAGLAALQPGPPRGAAVDRPGPRGH